MKESLDMVESIAATMRTKYDATNLPVVDRLCLRAVQAALDEIDRMKEALVERENHIREDLTQMLVAFLNRHADANITEEDVKVVVMNWSDETISILDSAGAAMFKRRMERKDNGQA